MTGRAVVERFGLTARELREGPRARRLPDGVHRPCGRPALRFADRVAAVASEVCWLESLQPGEGPWAPGLDVDDSFADNGERPIVAVRSGRGVGLAVVRRDDLGEWALEFVWVLPSQRRRGIARELVEAAMADLGVSQPLRVGLPLFPDGRRLLLGMGLTVVEGAVGTPPRPVRRDLESTIAVERAELEPKARSPAEPEPVEFDPHSSG